MTRRPSRLPLSARPMAPDRKDRPGWQVCSKCDAAWPTANPLPGRWLCPLCGGETVFEAKEE